MAAPRIIVNKKWLKKKQEMAKEETNGKKNGKKNKKWNKYDNEYTKWILPLSAYCKVANHQGPEPEKAPSTSTKKECKVAHHQGLGPDRGPLNSISRSRGSMRALELDKNVR